MAARTDWAREIALAVAGRTHATWEARVSAIWLASAGEGAAVDDGQRVALARVVEQQPHASLRAGGGEPGCGGEDPQPVAGCGNELPGGQARPRRARPASVSDRGAWTPA